MKTSWHPWHRPRRVVRQHLREAEQRLARGFGLWEGALYEIGGRIPCRPALPTSLISTPDSSYAHLAGPLGAVEKLREALILPRGGPHWHTSHSPGILNLADSPCFSPIGLFGTGIQSYFTFLRFLLLLNLLTMLLTACLVLLPLVWLRPPEPGPALKLSECLPCGPQSGHAAWASFGLSSTGPSARIPPSTPSGSLSIRVEAVELGDPILTLFSSHSAGLQCSNSPLPQSDIPRFHNPLWNILTGRVSGYLLSVLWDIWEMSDSSLKGPCSLKRDSGF